MKLSFASSLLIAGITSLFFTTSCTKDKCSKQYSFWTPVYASKDDARANVKNNPSRPIERPGKIFIRGNYIFLNEIDKGIHIIDNSNPFSPNKIAFIDIPGNLDLAVKGNMLYADFYDDLVAIDITNPQQVVVKKFTEDIFPERHWDNGFSPNPNSVIVDWKRTDTTVPSDCGGSRGFFGGPVSPDGLFLSIASNSGLQSAAASPFGMGGSMARFTIVSNHMYAVTNLALNVISISNPADPVFVTRTHLGWGIETIYPFNNRLFIGSTSGMFIYDLANPAAPSPLGRFAHARSCDPVIADNNYAYVTLRSGSTCQGFTNQLDVIDISNITSPVLKKTYQLTNPHGLSKDNSTMIICDGDAGVKFYDAADVNNIRLLKTISGIHATDVIAFGGWALVMANDGIYQYDYSSLDNIKLISKMTVNQ